jgi:hypothetical protein
VSILPFIESRGQFAEGNRQLGTGRASYSDTTCREEEEAEPLSGFEYDENVPMSTLIKEYLSENEYDLVIDNLYDCQFRNCGDVDTRWKVLAMQRRIMGMAHSVEIAEHEGLDTTGLSYQRAGARVGRSLYPWSLMDDPLLARHQENDEVSSICDLLNSSNQSALAKYIICAVHARALAILSTTWNHLALRNQSIRKWYSRTLLGMKTMEARLSWRVTSLVPLSLPLSLLMRNE